MKYYLWADNRMPSKLHFTKGIRNPLGFDVWWIAKTSQSLSIVAKTTTLQVTKIPSEMEVAPRYKLLKLLTQLTPFTLLILLTWHTLFCTVDVVYTVDMINNIC